MARILVWGYPGYPGVAPQDCLNWLDNSLREGTRVVADAHGDGIALDYAWPPTGSGILHSLRFDSANDTVTNYGELQDWTRKYGEWFPGWLGDYAIGIEDVGATTRIINGPYTPNSTQVTVALWNCVTDVLASVNDQAVWVHFGYGENVFNPVFYYGSNIWQYRVRLREYNSSNVFYWIFQVPAPPFGEWIHSAMTYDGQVVRVFQNGSLIASRAWSAPAGLWRGSAYIDMRSAQGRRLIDGLLIANYPLYAEDFSPHRFETGTVVARQELQQAYRLTAIDWSATVGAEYGQITKVEVNRAAGGWVTVAENSAGLTPPLTGLNYIVAGPDIVRLTLQPKQDTLQSETPVLDWLLANLEPIGQPLPKQVTIDARATAVLIDGTPSSVVVDARKRGVRG